MDFKSYMIAVEKRLNEMTDQERFDWIYSQARITEESKREQFLEKLCNKSQMTDLTLEQITEWCNQVELGKLYLEAEEEEVFDEDEWDYEWKTNYYDNFDMMLFLSRAINSGYQFVMAKEYEKAYAVLWRICTLEIEIHYISEEYGLEENEIELHDLAGTGLIKIDYKKLISHLLYCVYQIKKGEQRNEELYELFLSDMSYELVFSNILTVGPEMLKDVDLFMKNWCQYLAKEEGDKASELLLDACIYLGEENLLEVARENVELHPSLYFQYCKRKCELGKYQECIESAMEAIDEIASNLEIVADIADIAIKASEVLKDDKMKKYFARFAFESKPDSYHLLRLYEVAEEEDLQQAINQLKYIKENANTEDFEIEELKETCIKGKNHKDIYRFLLGDHKTIVEKCMRDQEALGWTYSLKGTIVPLLMLAIKKDTNFKTKAERALIDSMISRLSFREKDEKTFDEYFYIWRNKFHIAKEDQEKYLPWLLEEVDKRVEGVVGGGHRKSYYKAGELIVLLGAILEEQGNINMMQKLIDHYKKKHSRKYAFRNEIDELAQKS